MSTPKDMALYLRCSNCAGETLRPHDKTCPYFVMQEIDPKFPVPPDVVEDGVGYWTGCDYERISEDAAKMLEKYDTENSGGE